MFSNNNYEKIVFPYSRVFCYVEKFDNDELETMSKFGMGVIYSKTNYGLIFRKNDRCYNDNILKNYYNPYHKALNERVKHLLNENQYVVLIDCHSFSKEIIMIKENQHDLPDISIGFNGEKDKLAEECIRFFKKLNYKVNINYPYSGAMIPNDFITTPNTKLKSIMIEVNKEFYKGNVTMFEKLQNDINTLLSIVENLNFDY